MTEKIVDMLEFLRPKIEIDWQVSLFTPIYVILHCLKERNKKSKTYNDAAFIYLFVCPNATTNLLDD